MRSHDLNRLLDEPGRGAAKRGTRETFNYEGKTDILVRSEAVNNLIS